MHRLRIAPLAALVLAAGTLAGCIGGGGGGGSSKPKLEGVWQRTTGDLFVIDGLEELRFLDLREGGQGTIFGLQNTTGIRECASMLYSASREGTITIDAPDLNSGSSQARLLLWDREGSDLTLTDQDGNQTVFTKTDEVPASEACTVATVTVLPLPYSFPGYFGNLASDGTNLWYQNTVGDLVAIDPLTGTTASTPVASPGFPIASQGGDFWTMCHCGGDDVIRRWTLPNTAVDDVDMSTLLGSGGYSLDSAGVSTDGTLWVSGYRYDTASSMLAQLDTTGEPDILLQTLEGPLDNGQITFLGADRWVIASGLTQKLARVGPGGLAVETLSLPGTFYPYSIASHGGALYVTSEDAQYAPILIRIDVP